MSPRWKEAVALEYGRRPTPIVSARGEQELAERIIEEARRHGVHVAQDPVLLARLAQVDLEQEIPPQLYAAVAVMLSWVYWLRGMQPGDEKEDPPQAR